MTTDTKNVFELNWCIISKHFINELNIEQDINKYSRMWTNKWRTNSRNWKNVIYIIWFVRNSLNSRIKNEIKPFPSSKISF